MKQSSLAFFCCFAMSFFVTLTENLAFAGQKFFSATGVEIEISIQPGQKDLLTNNEIAAHIGISSTNNPEIDLSLCDDTVGIQCSYYLNGSPISPSKTYSVKKGETLTIVAKIPIGLAPALIEGRIVEKDPTVRGAAGAGLELAYILSGGDNDDTIWSGKLSLKALIASHSDYVSSNLSENEAVRFKAKTIGCKSFDSDELDAKAKSFDEKIRASKIAFEKVRQQRYIYWRSRWALTQNLLLLRESVREIQTGKYSCSPSN